MSRIFCQNSDICIDYDCPYKHGDANVCKYGIHCKEWKYDSCIYKHSLWCGNKKSVISTMIFRTLCNKVTCDINDFKHFHLKKIKRCKNNYICDYLPFQYCMEHQANISFALGSKSNRKRKLEYSGAIDDNFPYKRIKFSSNSDIRRVSI